MPRLPADGLFNCIFVFHSRTSNYFEIPTASSSLSDSLHHAYLFLLWYAQKTSEISRPKHVSLGQMLPSSLISSSFSATHPWTFLEYV